MKKSLFLLLITPFLLASCVRNNGLCYCKNSVDDDMNGICDICKKPIEGSCIHIDEDGDQFCDKCGQYLEVEVGPCENHVDTDLDGKCDKCGADLSSPEHSHVDGDGDGKCDHCGAQMTICDGNHVDSNSDGKCDKCGADVSTPTPPPTPHEEITTYLVLSSVGLYKGSKGNSILDKNLENAVAFIGYPGDPLPGKEDVTHLYGNCDFAGWLCYEGKGAPTTYTVVPNEANKILYASFVDNGKTPINPDPSGGGGSDDPVIDPTTMKTYYLHTEFNVNNSPNYWDADGAKIYVWVWSDSVAGTSYPMTKDGEHYYKVDIPKDTYTSIIFVRCSADSTFFSWDNKWNQTVDLAFDASKTVARITSWGPGYGANSTVEWVS